MNTYYRLENNKYTTPVYRLYKWYIILKTTKKDQKLL